MKHTFRTQGTFVARIISEDMQIIPLIDSFLLNCRGKGLAKGTVEFYRKKLEYFARFCHENGVHFITEITPSHIRYFLDLLTENGHNEGGVHAAYRSLKTFMFWYEDEVEPEGWKNPIRKVATPRRSKIILDPVTIETLDAMLDTCERGTFAGDRDRAILLCLFDCGARAQEFLDIDLSDIKITMGEITIRSGKGRKTRTIYIGAKCRKAIRTYIKHRFDRLPALWVREDQEGRLEYWGLRSILVRRATDAGVKTPSLHAFRRGFALNMLRNGVDVYALQRLMGHETLDILKQYLKQTDQDLLLAHRLGSPVDTNMK